MSAAPRLVEPRDKAARPRFRLTEVPGAEGVLTAILVIVIVAALRLGISLLVPIAISLLLSVLCTTPVRWLRRHGVPAALGAAVIVFGAVGLIGAGAAMLARPATEWLQSAPARLPDIEAKIRRLMRPIAAIEKTAEGVQRAANTASAAASPVQKVTVQTPGFMTRLSGSTMNAVAAILTILFLTYFFTSTEQLLMRKLVGLMPDRIRQVRVVRVLTEIEKQTSRYLSLTTLISLGVGLATWGLLAIAGLPNAALWGAVAAVLNFIPYVGTLVSAVLIGSAALLTFDGIERTVVVLIAFFAIHIISGNIVTPLVLGRVLPLNHLAVFVGLVFWTWVWGVPGAILAVPLTVMLKVVCDHVDRLRPVAVLLES